MTTGRTSAASLVTSRPTLTGNKHDNPARHGEVDQKVEYTTGILIVYLNYLQFEFTFRANINNNVDLSSDSSLAAALPSPGCNSPITYNIKSRCVLVPYMERCTKNRSNVCNPRATVFVCCRLLFCPTFFCGALLLLSNERPGFHNSARRPCREGNKKHRRLNWTQRNPRSVQEFAAVRAIVLRGALQLVGLERFACLLCLELWEQFNGL